MAGDRRGGESGRRGRQARPEGGMRTAAIRRSFHALRYALPRRGGETRSGRTGDAASGPREVLPPARVRLGGAERLSTDLRGTNRDLQTLVTIGRFRDDLRARINLWTFQLPGLAERPADIEPNRQYELDRYAERTGSRITFNKEAREAFLTFARSPPRVGPRISAT